MAGWFQVHQVLLGHGNAGQAHNPIARFASMVMMFRLATCYFGPPRRYFVVAPTPRRWSQVFFSVRRSRRLTLTPSIIGPHAASFSWTGKNSAPGIQSYEGTITHVQSMSVDQ
jgi:hypothetical protein